MCHLDAASLDVLHSSLCFLSEALQSNPASVQGIFSARGGHTAVDDVSHLRSQVQAPGPMEVARLMIMWLSSAPRIALPLKVQKRVISATATNSWNESSGSRPLEVELGRERRKGRLGHEMLTP